MIQYFVNILPLEKRLSKFRELEGEEAELKIKVDDLSSKFNLSNTIIKSIDCGNIRDKAEGDRGSFLKDLGNIHRRLQEIKSLKDRILKGQDVQKALNKDSEKEVFRRTKDAFKRNVITMSVWKEAYRTLTDSSKVKYSDVVVWWDGKILLLERATLGIGDSKKGWCVPGGHVDPGEDFVQAAERELLEETGIVLKEGCELNVRGEFQGEDIHITYFEVYLNEEPTLVLDNGEHKQYCWVDSQKLSEYPMIFDMAENLGTIFNFGETVVTKIEDIKKSVDYVQKYNEWNTQNGEPAYDKVSEGSVLEFLQNNYEDLSLDEDFKENLLKEIKENTN